MYGKIFDSIYDSTLADDWRALVTFQQMIVLCDADGMVDMTPTAIARRTGIPIEYIEAGIKILENPDPYSRTPDQEGRRIELIDEHRPWGWHIVNHSLYKHLQDSDTVRAQTRERVRRHREKKKGYQCNVTVTDGNGQKRHTDTDTYTDTKKEKGKTKKRFSPPTVEEIREYIAEKGYSVNADRFYNFYAAKDWMIGKNKMKSWKHSVATWEHSDKPKDSLSDYGKGGI